MTTIANCISLVEAQLVKTTLEGNGLTAFIPDEFTMENAPGYALALGGLRVQVEDEDAAAARTILGVPPPPEPI